MITELNNCVGSVKVTCDSLVVINTVQLVTMVTRSMHVTGKILLVYNLMACYQPLVFLHNYSVSGKAIIIHSVVTTDFT